MQIKSWYSNLKSDRQNLCDYSSLDYSDNQVKNMQKRLHSLSKQDDLFKLHLFDRHGTLAVIHFTSNQAWLNPMRQNYHTDESFDYAIATVDDLSLVNRKQFMVLNDWLWNLVWNSPALAKIVAPEDGHYKINHWPKPVDLNMQKQIFQLSACCVQGVKISTIAKQLDIPQNVVQRFIAANLMINNLEKISIWDRHYSPPAIAKEEVNSVKSFLGLIRKKLKI